MNHMTWYMLLSKIHGWLGIKPNEMDNLSGKRKLSKKHF